MSLSSEKDYKARLLAAVKKEVKHVMEESVTRKYVHEDSCSVTSLCGAVEACLSQGLRRRALGLFKTSSTTALLHKIAKHSPEAANISQKVQELENFEPNRKSSSSDSLTKPTLKKHSSLPSTSPLPKYLWIRLALFDKQLAKIIDHLVSNAVRYYDKDAFLADADFGNILSSLLVGPCALEYSRTRTPDQFWTDPPADELVQRHRISSPSYTPSLHHHTSSPSLHHSPTTSLINYRRNDSHDHHSPRTISSPITSSSAAAVMKKDCVESMHQNHRAALLFGKNNVRVLPAGGELHEAIPGYLALHQSVGNGAGLVIKWTPNELMNGGGEQMEGDVGDVDKSIYWDYALQVRLDEVVYVHCHQDSETGGTIILVGQDGVQRPPIHFPKGGHMLAFLSCIENGLLPRGRLDPPLWSQRSANTLSAVASLDSSSSVIGARKKRRPLPALAEVEETTRDYVFRIVDNGSAHKEIIKRSELLDRNSTHSQPTKIRIQLASSSTSSDSSTKSFSLDHSVLSGVPDSPPSVCIQAVCDSMKKQIISRAFYGWLAYCRHLSTIRTHLSGLVNVDVINGDNAEKGITLDKWMELCIDGVVSDFTEVFRLVYFGGIADELRKDIWPYLLGHYKFGSTSDERIQLNEETKQSYENTMSEWLAVEAIVKQRDKETTANAIAKLSSESMSGENVPAKIHRDLSNDVFEDISDYDYVSDDEQRNNDDDNSPDQKRQKKTKQNTITYEDSSLEDEQTPTSKEDMPVEAGTSQNTQGIEDGNREECCDDVNDNDVTDMDTTEASISTANPTDCAIPNPPPEHQQLHEFAQHNVIVTNASVDNNGCCPGGKSPEPGATGAAAAAAAVGLAAVCEEADAAAGNNNCLDAHALISPAMSACVSPASSNGGVYSTELLETFGLNLHRIEKDVQRCDRNYWYFANDNLDKLRNIMCTYVWDHLDIGYMQGMCDLVAPLLVVFNDESLTYACFCHLMERLVENFPNGSAMDCHFANMRSLIQILDAEMYELMHAHGDYTHFYFCYRWFLLDFKRELLYPDVFATWEVIWAAQRVSSAHFVLFLALALLETYREIILANSMDFTDIIKFFNEMAERHNISSVLNLARDLVLQLQILIENK